MGLKKKHISTSYFSIHVTYGRGLGPHLKENILEVVHVKKKQDYFRSYEPLLEEESVFQTHRPYDLWVEESFVGEIN